MFQVKILYFLTAVLVVVCASENDTINNVDTKRSAVCLIQRVAQHNHITATYTKVNFAQRNGTTHVECKLKLGTEEYHGNSTSFSKAKEKVAREAYALTKYTKPPLKNQTCIAPPVPPKNDISLLEEYATAIRKFTIYEETHSGIGKYEYKVTLDGKSATAASESTKKEAKKLAAASLIAQIGRESVINTLTSKYNRTEHHTMEPEERLRKIIRVTDLSGDGTYTKLRETSEREAGKTVKRIVMQVEAKNAIAAGAGYTEDEASSNAAANLLRHLGFVVDYPPKTQN